MSSIFYDNPLKFAEPGAVRCAAWSRNDDTPLLAVAEGAQVHVFREDGEEVPDLMQSRAVVCTSLAWHPHAMVLATGWSDGALMFTCGSTGTTREDREIHRDAEIVQIAFNPKGERCVTTDAGGVVGVWKTDHKGIMSTMCHYRKPGCHDKVVFRTMSKTAEGHLEPELENPPFFFGGEVGTIYLADDFGVCSERNKVGAPIALLEYYHDKDTVVVITQKSVILVQFTLDADRRVRDETKLKLSCGPQPEKLQGVWAGPGLLATVSHESIVRFWNLADDESYILSLQGIDERNSMAGDKVTAIDFNARKRVLAVGTRSGKMVQWRCSTLNGAPKSESCWQVLPVVRIGANELTVDNLKWGPGENLLHVKTARSNIILSEAQLNSAVQPPFLAVQTSPKQVLLYNTKQQTRCIINAAFRVRGLSMAGTFIMLWSSRQVVVYEIEGTGGSCTVHATFRRDQAPITSAVLISQGSGQRGSMDRIVAVASRDKIEFCNLQGLPQRGTVQFAQETEGLPMCLDAHGAHLAAVTTNSVLRLWDVSKSQPKLLGAPRKFEGENDAPLGEIRNIKVNSDGTRVSMLVDQRLGPSHSAGANGQPLKVPDSRIFVYDLDADIFLTYPVGECRTPVAQAWEAADPRLLYCECVPQALAYQADGEGGGFVATAGGSLPGSPAAAAAGNGGGRSVPTSPTGMASPNGATKGSLLGTGLGVASGTAKEVQQDVEPQHCVLTLFVAGNPSESVLLQDSIACVDQEVGGMPRMPVGLIVPHVYFARQTAGDGQGAAAEAAGADVDTLTAAISRTVLRDFAGLENVDEETKAALLDFSYYLACGNIDEAYKAVKGVRSQNVWESMSKMCVKTGRLDVAQKCLGQMGHARAAGALRLCEEPEPEARLAVVAVHLDMLEDAEQLLRKCDRFDLLNQLYQACGEWEKALDIAKVKDRVHLKSTHFAYAQHLEALEDVQSALSHFELSGTYRTESPRLLCAMGMTDDLEAYIEQSEDHQLHRWYAQYLESKAQLEMAAVEYKKANDNLSLCRVACFNKDLDKARRICEESMDLAACYHLARHLEAEGMCKDAMHFFQKAGRSGHAIRLAQENNYDGDLMSLALSADPASQIQAAKYYEQRGHNSKAVILFQKAGCQKRALDLCFSARLFDALRKIADDLSADSDPEVLAKCAEFFMQHNQHEKAVHLLSMSRQYEKSVELCAEHDVQITEDMAERMTPEKGSVEAGFRAEILAKVAALCKKQGSFQLACKKYTQAGDKLKAMKSLLKSGDTEKIIFFAGTARQPDIYVLAGNYLQSLDWHNDQEIMKSIIQFYSKAKAFDKLAAFYDACAQVEIDEYRDYEKAGGALREAKKYIQRAAGGDEHDVRVQQLVKRIQMVDEFANVPKLKDTPDQLVQACEAMLRNPEIETAVRVGDIFAQLVEHFSEQQQYTEAYATVERMRECGIIPTPYIDRALLESVYRNVGLRVPEDAPAGGAPVHPGVGEELEGVNEEIEDEIDDQ